MITSKVPGIIWDPIVHNFSSPRLMAVSGVVVHLQAGHGDLKDWFNNPASEVSAHYQNRIDGSVKQFLAESDVAWHAGIEAKYLVPGYEGPHKPTWPYIKPNANPNQYLIGIENEGVVTDVWPDVQVEKLTDLIADIAFRYNFEVGPQTVVKHHDIWDDHICPGPLCPFDKIVKMAADKLQVLKGI
jgi:N-acetyl-anhydromuramyl-L-alanine amidase AmpD